MPTSQNVKDEVRRLIEELPEDMTWEDLQQAVQHQQAIELGIRHIDLGYTDPSDEERRRLEVPKK